MLPSSSSLIPSRKTTPINHNVACGLVSALRGAQGGGHLGAAGAAEGHHVLPGGPAADRAAGPRGPQRDPGGPDQHRRRARGRGPGRGRRGALLRQGQAGPSQEEEVEIYDIS